MKQVFAALGALALGATAMYYFDPEQGRRRRAMVADRVDSVSHDARDYLEGRRRRTADRVRGLFARVRSRLVAEPPTDQQLHGHVRSRLGRAVSYPHAIETDVQQGRVVLKGDVLEREFNTLMAEIWSIPGVKAIDSQLALHSEPGNVPMMQGRPHRTSRARLRNAARNAAATLAVAGGVGTGLRAMRAGSEGGAHTGLMSVAIALLTFGVGDGAQRLMRRRRVQRRPQAAERGERGEAPAAEHIPERAAEPTPALLNPAAWH